MQLKTIENLSLPGKDSEFAAGIRMMEGGSITKGIGGHAARGKLKIV